MKTHGKPVAVISSVFLLLLIAQYGWSQTAVYVDQPTYFTSQPHFEAGGFPSTYVAGTIGTLVQMNNTATPFSKVMRSDSYLEFASDMIPVEAGETLYGEIWAMRETGSSGTSGVLYYGIARYDKDMQPVATNSGIDYFVVSGVTVPQNSTWQKYSGTTSLATSHTPYSGSDGGPVRYVQVWVIINNTAGTIPTYWGGVILRRVSPVRGTGPVAFNGKVGIGTTNPGQQLVVAGTTSDYGLLQIGNSSSGGEASLGFISGMATSGSTPTSTNGNDYIWAIGSNTGGIGGSKFGIFNKGKGANTMVWQSNGNVGIGTASPAEPLDIVGNARVSKDDGYLILNRSATSKYLGVSHRTNSVAKWFVGLRENLTSDNYIIYNEANGTDVMTLDVSSSNAWFAGNVGIGTTTPSEKLSVNGNIIAKKVKVTQSGWPDYVFNESYTLTPLTEVEAYIKRNGHLKGIPAANEVEKHGQDLGEMNKLLLEKVEEITLYMINLEKENRLLRERVQLLEEAGKR